MGSFSNSISLMIFVSILFLGCFNIYGKQEKDDANRLVLGNINNEGLEKHSETFTSSITGVAYLVDVYIPKNHAQSNSKYPAIYATDGQWISKGFSEIIESIKKEVILIAIHQGPEDRRLLDYLLPGAYNYYNLLLTELLPHLEDKFPIDTSNRTLVGVSAGGMLASTILFIEDPEKPVFKNYLIVDAPFFHYGHTSKTIDLESKRYAANKKMQITLFLTGALAEGELGPFDTDVTRFENLMM